MFSVKKTMADLDIQPFPFEDAEGETQLLPHLYSLSAKRAQHIMALADSDPIGALEALAPELATVPLGAAMPLMTDYFAHCTQGDAGKPSASSGSSKSTPRPSKRTSPATTKATTRKR